jgi:hypothetical protein
MSIRTCDFDQNEATFGCSLHNGYYCQHHHAEHVCDDQQHRSFKVKNALTPDSFNLLQTKLISRIAFIQQSKIEITNKAATLMKRIADGYTLSIEKLDNEIAKYTEYIKNNNFDKETLENVRNILKNNLKIEISDQGGFSVNLAEEERKDANNRIPSK